MKNWSKKLLSALCVAALILGLVPLGVPALAAGEHTLWLVGDSTACDYAADADANYFYKRCGFGTALKEYVDATYTVENLAESGRSSKSFPNESSAAYEKLTAGITPGDVLLIAFGHNDQKTDEAHYTAPGGTSTTEGSFAKSLYDNYIKIAQDARATPILCTPIVRRSDSGQYTNDKIHQANGGDYAEDIRKLGKELNVPVVDMTNLTKEKYTEVGVDASADFHAHLANKNVDNTHLNAYGAQVVAQILAGELAKLDSLDLAAHILSDKVSATLDKATLLVQNPGWVDPATLPYTPPSTTSTQCEPYKVGNATFFGTAMGDLGGNASASNHIRETTESGDMRIAVLNSKGKIANGADGIVMYYYPVPMGESFTLTATATVNAISDASNPQQGGFGLMARDDMYIDLGKNDLPNLHSDYVTAGSLGDGSGVNFARKGGSLNTGSNSLTLAAGQSYQLSIVRSVDGNYACATDGVSSTYDYSIDNIDTAYTYVGMFCARNMDVTYSNITLVVDGVTLCGGSGSGGSEGDNPPAPPAEVGDMIAGGGLETLFAELEGVQDANVTAVKYTGAMTGELTGDDLEYLVRDAEGGVRIDIPGVKAGAYELTVTVDGQDYVAKDIQVLAHDRSGFAHQTVADDNTCTPYTEGVGAYNDDGTLKDNAIVLYVTDENKDTDAVTLSYNGVTSTGIGNILNSKGQSDSNKRKLLQQVSQAGIPIVVRILGKVTNPAGTTTPWSTENGGSKDDGGHMCIMQYVGNITIEGIGPDATVDGWGFSFSADGTGRTAEKNNKRDGQGENIEVRNLTFRNVPEDCIGINGSQDDKDGFKDSAEHVWVHNNSFYGPSGLHDESNDGDKSDGDGALDFRNGEYMTSSYNYFEGYHKTSLVGGGDDNLQYHVTWHHNHWKDVDSRAPLARQADMHIYNNYYENQKSYCMSLRGKSYIFSEFNIFDGCTNPIILEASSGSSVPVGACKSYNDVFENCTWKINADKQARGDNNIVTDKSQAVDSANKFANFDTAAGSYVAKGNYKLDTTADALKNIETYGGVMKAAAAMTTVPFAPASGSEPTEPSLTLTPETLSLVVGETGKLTATLTGSDETITWTSSKPAVATVDNGTVTAVSAGTATITAKAGELTATATVTVTAKGEEPKPDCAELDAAINKAIDLNNHTQVSDDGSDINTAQKWAPWAQFEALSAAINAAIGVSENAKTQAEVDAALEALNAVIADFEAARQDGADPDAPILAETILFNPEELTLKVGASGKITATITPDNVTHKTVYWTTEDTKLITLSAETSQSGEAVTVTARAAGEATITVTADSVMYDIPVTITRGSSSSSSSGGRAPDRTPAKTETTTNDSGNTVKTESKSNGDKTVTVTDESGEVVAKVEIPATVPELSYKFEDVPDEHWAAKAINEVAALGIVQGVSTGEHVFDLNSAITRAAMAQILFNLSQGKAGMANTFADSADGWYTDAIAWAAGAGVVTGVSDTSFAPNDSITREQLATMLYRYAKLLDLDVSEKGDLTAYVDGAAVDSWASEAMAWAVGAGLLQGKGNNDLDPTASATRAETATIMSRFLSLVK